MNTIKDLQVMIPIIETKINYSFQDKDLLILAFTHRSFVNEQRDCELSHNERLEFLGDMVLGLLISEYLYQYLPSHAEGDLSYLRSRLVDAPSCMRYLLHLGVEDYILLGKGEQKNQGKGRDSILADLFEALIAVVYLDGGLEAAKHFLFKNLSIIINEILKTPECNWKALLQDFSQKQYQEPPIYKVMKTEGPDHSKVFYVSVFIDEKEMGSGKGSSKKLAQQIAAEEAAKSLGADLKPSLPEVEA
jgi:ribonuclease-3